MYDRKFRFNKKSSGWQKRRIMQAAVYSIFAVSVVLLLAGMRELGNRRSAYLLEHRPVGETIARIIQSEGETGRHLFKPHLVITYTIDSSHYTLRLNNDKIHYKAGQQYRILYSIDQPDIFRILNEVGG
jgi:hypothetical protein